MYIKLCCFIFKSLGPSKFKREFRLAFIRLALKSKTNSINISLDTIWSISLPHRACIL